MLFKDKAMQEKYPMLNLYTRRVKVPEREIVGRDDVMRSILASMHRPELCNVMLLADPGTGKTAVVQGLRVKDKTRSYLEIGLSSMIAATGSDSFPGALEKMFDEVILFRKNMESEIVLFIDEFHRIIKVSPQAVEALKPLLADSGTRGIKVIAATTYDEFQEYVLPNQALVERFQRLNLPETDKAVTVEILKGMANRYEVGDVISDILYDSIYDYTNRYIPANMQPRKSILVLDSMVGWNRSEGREFDMSLLADVIYEQEGINVAFRVDATKIKEELDKRVFAQSLATSTLEKRLQICVADFQNKGRPMSSFLFAGSSGVGKTELAKALTSILFEDEKRMIRMDCSEYANPDSLNRFRLELTSRVWAMPYCIILLDEIEKACGEVTRLLLQVLDDGRLLDEYNREVVFTNAYIILTTNAGSEVFKNIAQYNPDNDGSGAEMKRYEKLIRTSLQGTTGGNKFPPELLGRIDAIIPFQPLSEHTMVRIVVKKLEDLKQLAMDKHGVEVRFENRIVPYLVKDNLDTDTDSGGARNVIGKLESEITTAVARYINAHPYDRKIQVIVKGEMAADHKNMRESQAYIVVQPA